MALWVTSSAPSKTSGTSIECSGNDWESRNIPEGEGTVLSQKRAEGRSIYFIYVLNTQGFQELLQKLTLKVDVWYH